MTAHPSPCLRPGVTRAEIDAWLPDCTLPQLEADLRNIQRRLGTPGEIPGDVECAQAIVHRINNVLTAQQAEQTLRELDALESEI